VETARVDGHRKANGEAKTHRSSEHANPTRGHQTAVTVLAHRYAIGRVESADAF
jgi:hypothetical protein